MLLGDRTKSQVKNLSNTGFRYLFIILASIVALNIMAFGGYYLIHVRMRQIRSLIDTRVEAQKSNDLSLRANIKTLGEIGQAVKDRKPKIFVEMLESLKFDVVQASSGKRALSAVDQAKEDQP